MSIKLPKSNPLSCHMVFISERMWWSGLFHKIAQESSVWRSPGRPTARVPQELSSATVSNPCQFLCLETQPSTGRLTTHNPLSQPILSDISSMESHLRETAAQIHNKMSFYENTPRRKTIKGSEADQKESC